MHGEALQLVGTAGGNRYRGSGVVRDNDGLMKYYQAHLIAVVALTVSGCGTGPLADANTPAAPAPNANPADSADAPAQESATPTPIEPPASIELTLDEMLYQAVRHIEFAAHDEPAIIVQAYEIAMAGRAGLVVDLESTITTQADGEKQACTTTIVERHWWLHAPTTEAPRLLERALDLPLTIDHRCTQETGREAHAHFELQINSQFDTQVVATVRASDEYTPFPGEVWVFDLVDDSFVPSIFPPALDHDETDPSSPCWDWLRGHLSGAFDYDGRVVRSGEVRDDFESTVVSFPDAFWDGQENVLDFLGSADARSNTQTALRIDEGTVDIAGELRTCRGAVTIRPLQSWSHTLEQMKWVHELVELGVIHDEGQRWFHPFFTIEADAVVQLDQEQRASRLVLVAKEAEIFTNLQHWTDGPYMEWGRHFIQEIQSCKPTDMGKPICRVRARSDNPAYDEKLDETRSVTLPGLFIGR